MKPAEGLTLLFDWPSRHSVHVGLPLALVVSALLHGAGIAAFQLMPPKSPAWERRSAAAYVLPSGLPAAKYLERIIAATDPALFSPVALEERDLREIPTAKYSASFDTWEPSLEPPPAVRQVVLSPVAAFGPVRKPAPPPDSPSGPTFTPPTKLSFSGGLQEREFTPAESAAFTAPPRQNLLPAEFLVAAAPDGGVLHAFPLSSSGNEDLDRNALAGLLAGKFSASTSSSPAWGLATFLWGSDVSRETR